MSRDLRFLTTRLEAVHDPRLSAPRQPAADAGNRGGTPVDFPASSRITEFCARPSDASCQALSRIIARSRCDSPHASNLKVSRRFRSSAAAHSCGAATPDPCGGRDPGMKHMRIPKLSILSTLALIVVAASVVPAYAEPAHAGPVADTRFGVAEGFRNPDVMADIGASWERLILPWDQIQPDRPGDFSHLGQTLTRNQVQTELNRGTKVAGLLQFTPNWAAANPADGKRSVPNNLGLAFDDPNNYFGQYVTQTVQVLHGPDRPVDHLERARVQTGRSRRRRQLHLARLRRGVRATHESRLPGGEEGQSERHRVVPRHVVLGRRNSNRTQFYDRIMAILARDPDAARTTTITTPFR